MSLLGILGGFETCQKQIFHIFGTREKIRNFFFQEKSGFFGKNRYFIGNYRFLSEKSTIFRRFFYFRFFHPNIFSSTTEIRYFTEKLAEIGDFFVHDGRIIKHTSKCNYTCLPECLHAMNETRLTMPHVPSSRRLHYSHHSICH